MKFRITLVRLEDNTTCREVFIADNRYQAVAKAFMYFAHKEQHDCLDTWKVLSAEQVTPDPNVSLESALDDLKAVIRQGDLTADERLVAKYVLEHCLAALKSSS